MASVPGCSLCRLAENIKQKLGNGKYPFLVYSVFIVLSIEFLSIAFNLIYSPIGSNCNDIYAYKIYPMLTQFVLFILFLSISLWNERLRFCRRKSAATFYLAVYYLFGFTAVAFCFSANFYFLIVSLGMIIMSLNLMIQSFKSK